MKRIGFAKHPHVVGLFGCVSTPVPVCILLEYLEYGDLLTYLQNINEEVTLCSISRIYFQALESRIGSKLSLELIPYNIIIILNGESLEL